MKFEVNTATLSTTVSTLQENLEEVTAKRKGMYASLSALDSMWQGEAHSTFETQYELDNEKMVELISEIETYISNVSKARENYDTTENKANDLAKSIHI